ncbi:MAG: hypothetical protein WD942_05555 [Dehalococcoidia bacterium]
MINESISAVVERNVVWTGVSATEPYEVGWAREAVIFVRALKGARGSLPKARVEISPDGMRWVAEGTTFDLPGEPDAVSFAKVTNFGGWLRVSADLQDAEVTVLVTMQLKA